MRSESTSALGQPRETKLILGAMLSLITVLTWLAWYSAALAIGFSIPFAAVSALAPASITKAQGRTPRHLFDLCFYQVSRGECHLRQYRGDRCPKYYQLEYSVIVGETKYSVATIY